MVFNVCRICLSNNEDLIDIFSDVGSKRNVALIVSQHFWFQIEETDKFSKKICLNCWDKVDKFHEFYNEIEELYKSTNWETFALNNKNSNPEDKIYIQEHNNTDDYKIDDNHLVVKLEPQNFDDIQVDFSGSNDDIEYANYSSNFERDDSNDTNDFKIPPPLKSKTKRKFSSENNTPNLSTKSNKISSEEMETKKREIYNFESEQIRQFCKMDCDLCQEQFVDLDSAIKHYRNDHNMQGYLTCCGIKLAKHSSAIKHINRHINPVAYKKETFKHSAGGESSSEAQSDLEEMNNHELIVSGVITSSNRKIRRRCQGCYMELSQQCGVEIARRRAKCVSTYCNKCLNQPFLCIKHFCNRHQIKMN